MIPTFAAASMLLSPLNIEEERFVYPILTLQEQLCLPSDYAEDEEEREKPLYELLRKLTRLTEKEKDRLIKTSEYHKKMSMNHLEYAKKAFSKMADRSGREFCTDSVIAAISTIAGADLRAKAVVALMIYVVRFAESGCTHFWIGIDHITSSRTHAQTSDLCLLRVKYD